MRISDWSSDVCSSDLMRTTLWAGLIPAWLYNRARQQDRLRLFEAGVCFTLDGDKVVETSRLAGLIAGRALPQPWASASRPAAFYDLKIDRKRPRMNSSH